uniref:Serine/threonine protein kinase putative n=1 Tax=Albugo laibachii Nc14 TaxID=890382 RepID=F0WLC7_9STRA|nr:serine/threonine protein kinase putative [Albugo laibachii Nc14]|eukprot:CCA22090.1 serine/threonine protein kinase putative [Albugo laibachii Nc14]
MLLTSIILSDTYRRYERESLEMNRNGRRKRSFSRSFSMRSRSPRDDIKASGSARSQLLLMVDIVLERLGLGEMDRTAIEYAQIATESVPGSGKREENDIMKSGRNKSGLEMSKTQVTVVERKMIRLEDLKESLGIISLLDVSRSLYLRIKPKLRLYIIDKIIREAGLGTFGRVLECLDKQRDRAVAIKVVRRVEKYTESAKIEARILQDLNEMDYFHESLCVRMYKWFEYKGHVCMVFERLGCSLYDYLKNHDYKPFPLESIRAYAWQLLVALDYIHNIKLIHTDLKPENILLVDGTESKVTSASRSPLGSDSVDQCDRGRRGSRHRSKDSVYAKSDAGGRRTLTPPACNAVKLIDFGGATYDDESKSQIINTRQYRSPEVILGLGWSFASDIWSAGCIIAELYLGDLLFATHDNMEHLALMEACIGKLPHHMVAYACRKQPSDGFFHRGRLAWPQKAATKESVHHVRRMRTLREIVTQDHAKLGLLDLLKQMLVLDPHHRVSAKEALRHPFFDGFSRRDISRPVDRDSEHSSNRRKRGIWR